MRTRLPAQAERVETGVVQFGNDWPGYFIRGDGAIALAGEIEAFVAAVLRDEVPIPPEVVATFADLARRLAEVAV